MELQENNRADPTSNKMPEKTTDSVDIIQSTIGAFGRYHVFLCLLIFISKIPVAFHQMAIIFLAPKVTYSCSDSLESDICPCSHPVYNTSVFTNTITMEYDLICDKKWMVSFTQTIFQLGTLLGSVLFGMASDRFGRKKPILLAVVIQITMGIGAAYANDFVTFTILRFMVGASVGGTMVIGFVIMMEYVGAQYRELLSAVYQIPFNIGHMLLPLFSYYHRDFTTFQFLISLVGILLLSYFFLLPETARWLLAVKRSDEAVLLLEKVAKVNNLPTDDIKNKVELYQATMDKSNLKKGSILDLFRTPNLRKNIILMSFDWLTCSYCFYGVSQYVGQLSGNIFYNVAAGATITMFGTIASIPLMKFMGRRTLVIVFNFICAACLFVLAFIPSSIYSVICATVGQVSSFIVFVVVYLYGSELFPTVVRNAAIGFSSMMARVGSMIAPFVIDLGGTATWLPPAVFAVFPLVAGFLSFLLPETKGCPLMTTIEEGEQFGKKDNSHPANTVPTVTNNKY